MHLRISHKLEESIFRTGLMNLSPILKTPGWCPMEICGNALPCHDPPPCPGLKLAALMSLILDTSDFIVLNFGLVLRCDLFLSEKPRLCTQLRNSVNTTETWKTWGLPLLLLTYVLPSLEDFQLTPPNLFPQN